MRCAATRGSRRSCARSALGGRPEPGPSAHGDHMPVRNLVFQGGGVKGIAYVGVLGALEEAGALATVTRVAGTSAGAITAALVACGATAADLSDALTHTSFSSFCDGHGGILGDADRLLQSGFGIHPGE